MNNTERSVFELLNERFNVDTGVICDVNLDLPLTGDRIGMSDIDMVWFLYEIEKEFTIHITERELKERKLMTIRQVAHLIDQHYKDIN